ncbi:MAG: hypothetical protein ABWY25_09560 [Paenisporosarcina sp.]
MNESQYQTKLIKKIHDLLPGCYVLKNDPRFAQGIPDILILFNDKWAMLEIKMSGDASVQPNQEYYVELFAEMSFASFINPENEEDVLYALQHALGSIGETCIS